MRIMLTCHFRLNPSTRPIIALELQITKDHNLMSHRVPIVAGNWKMNKLTGDAVDTVKTLEAALADLQDVEVVVCPTATALKAVAQALNGDTVQLGAQNCYAKESGAFTGELSPQMLLDVGCQWTIIGHSERRQIFGENDTLLNEKLHFALKSGLKVMFCIGETLQEREGGTMQDVLRRQLLDGLNNLIDSDFANVVIAYEPVWAIGTGVTASPEQAEEAHHYVRDLIKEAFGGTIADALRIQYGGSIKPANAAELISKPNVDGFLVGGASLEAQSFGDIAKAAMTITNA